MSVNWAQLYADLSAQLQAHVDLPFYQDFFVNFYRAFIDGARWKLYLSGLRMTIEVTVLALIMGIILGVIVAVIRTAHDQQRPGRHNPILFLLNTIGTIYTTVIRGTPMIVQMLIMGSIIFASSRNFTVIGTIPWTLLLVWAGSLLGSHWRDLIQYNHIFLMAVIAVCVVATVVFVWHRRRRRNAS